MRQKRGLKLTSPHRSKWIWGLSVFLCMMSPFAFAQDMGEALTLDELLPTSVATPLINTLAPLLSHRPYQGATSLTYLSPDELNPDGTKPFLFGFRVELETTLMGVPSDVTLPSGGEEPGEALADSLPSIPMARILVKKSINPKLDFAISGLYYKRNYFGGLSAKLLIFAPDEGLHWAIRGSYSRTSLDFQSLGLPSYSMDIDGITTADVSLQLLTEMATAELVASRKLAFAEPYFGLGILSSRGQIKVPVTISDLDYSTRLSTAIAYNQGYYGFTGVSFYLNSLGFTLGLEGSASSLGMHSLGLILGFRI